MPTQRLYCILCQKTFANDKTLATHTRKFHSETEHPLSLRNTAINVPSHLINDNFQTQARNFIHTHKNNLLIASININSIRNKFHHIEFLLNEQYLDILVINETRLTKNDDDQNFLNPFYYCHRRDRETDSGGGIMVFIKKELKIEGFHCDEDHEIIRFIFCPNYKSKIACIACYRPPNPENESSFISHLEFLSSSYESLVADVIIVGDINFDMLDRNHNKLWDLCQSFGYRNTISTGTRLNPTTKKYTLLDVILCLVLAYFLSSEVINVPFSDHSFIISAFDYKKKYNKSEKRLTRCLNKDKILLLKNRVKNVFASLPIAGICVNFQWNLIKLTLVSCLDSIAKLKHVPSKKSNNSPWIDKEYTMLAKKKDSSYRKAIALSQSKLLWEDFKFYRNKCASLFLRQKSLYFKNFISNTSLSTKKLWKKLAPYISPNKKSVLIASVILSDNLNNTDIDLASAFCNYFANVTLSFNFLDFAICLLYVTNHLIMCCPSGHLDENNRLYIRELTLDEVTKGLKALVPNSGVGEVGIESVIFSECADEIGMHITTLFNQIITTGVYPEEWKCAHITPVYKGKGPKKSLDSYRPISILSPVSKLFEKLLAEQIFYYLESNKLLHPAQYGFREKLSCELALNSLMETIRNGLDSKNDVISVFLDFSKAFDTIDHRLLINKLKFYNFDISLINLIENYLANRSIKVNANGKLSHSSALTTGVPQGSVLGPLLFIIFINDMCHLRLKSEIMLYADDTTITLIGKNPLTIINDIESDLVVLTEWLNHNKLVLNVKKSQAMCFNTNQILHKDIQKERLKLHIKCNNNIILFSSNVKLLGIEIDNKLTFEAQTKALCKKVNIKSYLLNKTLFLFTNNFRPILFKLFIQSHFDYCSTLTTHFTNKIHPTSLNLCFERSIFRILKIKISKKPILEQYAILKKFRILPLQLRLFFRLNTFIFNVFKNKNSVFFNIFNSYQSKRATRAHFITPPFLKQFKQYSFTSISCKLLNLFIYENLQIDNISSFKKYLHTNIIDLYMSSKEFWT